MNRTVRRFLRSAASFDARTRMRRCFENATPRCGNEWNTGALKPAETMRRNGLDEDSRFE